MIHEYCGCSAHDCVYCAHNNLISICNKQQLSLPQDTPPAPQQHKGGGGRSCGGNSSCGHRCSNDIGSQERSRYNLYQLCSKSLMILCFEINFFKTVSNWSYIGDLND